MGALTAHGSPERTAHAGPEQWLPGRGVAVTGYGVVAAGRGAAATGQGVDAADHGVAWEIMKTHFS